MVSARDIARLVNAGVVVAAGHTMATPEEIARARAAGMTGFTHLYNAMPPLTARSPGPVGAALADRELWAGIIADLQHVSATSLEVAIAARGYQRTMLVTDAMPTVGTASDRFDLEAAKCVATKGGWSPPTAHWPARIWTWRARFGTLFVRLACRWRRRCIWRRARRRNRAQAVARRLEAGRAQRHVPRQQPRLRDRDCGARALLGAPTPSPRTCAPRASTWRCSSCRRWSTARLHLLMSAAAA